MSNSKKPSKTQAIESLVKSLGIDPRQVEKVIAFRTRQSSGSTFVQSILKLKGQPANRQYVNVVQSHSWNQDGHGGSDDNLTEYFETQPAPLNVLLGNTSPEIAWATNEFVPAFKLEQISRFDVADKGEDHDEGAGDYDAVSIAYENVIEDNIVSKQSVVRVAAAWGIVDDDDESGEAGLLIQLMQLPHTGQPGYVNIRHSSYFHSSCCSPYVGSTAVVEYFSGMPKLASLDARFRTHAVGDLSHL